MCVLRVCLCTSLSPSLPPPAPPLPCRYIFSVAHLQQTIKGPSSFHLDIDVKAPWLHLTLNMADLSSSEHCRLVA